MAAIIAQKGSDAWWYMAVEDLLPGHYREKASEYEKGTDTMDVWFDSGLFIYGLTFKCFWLLMRIKLECRSSLFDRRM